MRATDILVIEDDVYLAGFLQMALEDAGYHVRVAHSVMAALTMARVSLPHLVLLDLGLPDGHGRDVLSRLRTISTVPVIVLTSRDQLSEKMALFDLGADDYLVKPVQSRELMARITVQLRRQEIGEVLRYQDLEVRPQQHLVAHQGEQLDLSPTELAMLVLLLRQPGRIFSRAEVFQALRPAVPVAPRSNMVDVHLAKLRAKLRKVQLHGLIKTVREVGYVIREPTAEHGEKP